MLYPTTIYCCLVVTLMQIHPVLTSIHSIFNHYEEIHSRDISVRIKRDRNTERVSWKHLSFRALGMKFELKLVPDRGILSPDFLVHAINRNGHSDQLNIDLDDIYSGYDTNRPDTHVDAFHVNGVWQMHIRSPNGEFNVEPLSRFDPTSKGDISIIYNAKDVNTHNTTKSKSDSSHFCRASKLLIQRSRSATDVNTNNKGPPFRQRNEQQFINLKKSLTGAAASAPEEHHGVFDDLTNTSRTKRQSVQDTCDLLIVVDWRTFQGIGERSAESITKWVTHNLKQVDRALRTSGVSFGATTFGLQMSAMVIFTESTNNSNYHYNLPHNRLDDLDTLKSMFPQRLFTQYCLTHLLTQRRFPNGVLGIATIANAILGDANGVCATADEEDGDDDNNVEARNVGLSSVLDLEGRPMTTHMFTHVMAHEIAHNFGSEHDPYVTRGQQHQCSPGSDRGGKYLMWPTSGNSYDANALTLSPCSVGDVTKTLKVKAHLCFKSQTNLETSCGDGLLNPAEDCDKGPQLSPGDNDVCCTGKCRFNRGAACSPRHHPCCSSTCQTATTEHTCVAEINNPCAGVSRCDGKDPFHCPRVSPKPNLTPCPDNGTCWYGICSSFCETLSRDSNPPRHLESCTCDQNEKLMCTLCCRDKDGGECVPRGGSMDDGRPCLLGSCKGGVCLRKESKSDMFGTLLGRQEGTNTGNTVHNLQVTCMMTPVMLALSLLCKANLCI